MNYDRVILGEKCIYSTDSEKTQLNNNIIICGTSGSGKTMSISEPRLLETVNSSLILTVSKRKLVKKYTPLFEKRGYHVWDLNFVTPEQSNVSYDPMAYVDSDRDAAFLAEAIVKADPQKSGNTKADPYWDSSAISLLTALILYAKDKRRGFDEVLELTEMLEFGDEDNGMITTTLDLKLQGLQRKHRYAFNCWKTFRSTPLRTAKCIFSTLNDTLDKIFTPDLRVMIKNPNKVDFDILGTEKTILFVTTSAVNPVLNNFVNLFFGQAIKQLFEFAEKQPAGMLSVPVHMLFDDFACSSRIAQFPQFISIFREKGISVSLFIQSESQLVSMYGQNDATTIINNCDTYVYMGGMDLKTCRDISDRMNWPLEDVLYMPAGQELIFRRGDRPVSAKRYNICENVLYREVTETYERECWIERDRQ